MTDLSTYAGQAAHYAGVKSRLWNAEPKVKEPRRIVKERPVQPFQMWPPVRLPRVKTGPRIARKDPDDVGRFTTVADQILSEVAIAHKLTVPQLKSHRRWTEIVEARQEAFWRLSNETEMSLPMMGRKLGGFDHTTVLHSIRRHQKRLDDAAREPWVKPGAMRIVSEQRA